jgi:ribosomal protein S18 acetylase RimI-like enzyme
MSDAGLVQAIEEHSLNAWPAFQTLLVDGWVLRFADGYSRRANSVTPLYPSRGDSAEKIRACERLYADKGLPAIFKLATEGAGTLDALLAQRGYPSEARTSVQVLRLSEWPVDEVPEVKSSSLAAPEWVALHGVSGASPERQAIHARILAQIVLPRNFAAIEQAGRIIACGLGVAHAGLLGIFDLVVDPAHRRQGYAERLMAGLLAWGRQAGAHTAYLQVMLDNQPALRLYAKLGFREAYQYWYRVKR